MPIVQHERAHSPIREILRAFLEMFRRRRRVLTDQPPRGGEEPRPVRIGLCGGAKTEPCPTHAVRQRLADGVVRLETLDADRERMGDARFGQASEDRIVWSELIELELQEIDEQVNRIRDGG